MKPDVEYHEIKTDTEVLFPASGASDLHDPITRRTVIPKTVLIHLFRSETPDGDREWAHVAVYGPRRLKSGEAGHEISSFGWERETQHGNSIVARPDWLTQELADHMPDGWAPSLLGLKTEATNA